MEVNVMTDVLAKNDAIAASLRQRFKRRLEHSDGWKDSFRI